MGSDEADGRRQLGCSLRSRESRCLAVEAAICTSTRRPLKIPEIPKKHRLNDGTNTYAWDSRNRMVSADNNAASFTYDPLGRRVGKTLLAGSTNFLYDGANPVQELSGSSVTANLLTGGLDERFLRTTATETDNYLTDALGSTVALTGTTGSSEAEYSYGPFGSMSITGSTTNSYGYTGRETDGLGINYYRAR